MLDSYNLLSTGFLKMKISNFLIVMAALLAGGMLSAEAQEKKGSPAALLKVDAWKNADALRAKLSAELQNRLTDLSPEQLRAFLRNEDNRRLLLTYYLACAEKDAQESYRAYNEARTRDLNQKREQIANLSNEVKNKKGAEQKRAAFQLENARAELKKLEAEVASPAGLNGCDKVLSAICADAEWLEQIAFSGELPKFGRVVQIIAAIAADDSKALRKGVERDTVTATALEYARNDWGLTDAVNRANYFLKYWRKGRLNTSFDDLPIHQRRVACGWKNQHSSGTVKAFEWALNNVHIPDWQYPASCWRCGYIDPNMFGDSVQGPWYAAPFVGVYSDNHMAFTQYVGGVCGGLSHFGAASACANGVPALTAGEPGHCAYIVLVDGKWTPAYSLSWERGLHWIPLDNNWTYSSLHLVDSFNDPKSAGATRLSNAYRMLARLYWEADDMPKTLYCFEQSAKASPLNYPMWREYSSFLATKMPKDQEAWKKLNSVLCKGMASIYPEQAAELLKQRVYAHLPNSGMGYNDLVAVSATFWKHAKVMGPDRWYIEAFANRQLEMSRSVAEDKEEATIAHYVKVLAAAAPHDAYSGTMMAWGNSISNGLSADSKKKLTDAMVKALGSGKSLNSEQKAKLLGGLILTAERARDASTFHAISRMIDPKLIQGSAAIPAPTPFPGKLVSEGGMPFASSTSEWDAPHTHSGLLTQQGGRIHTGRDTDAWIAVKLPKHAYVTGVVFVGTNVWELIHRFRPLKVQVSDTGRDDDWHDVGSPIQNTQNYVNRFDLTGERPKALYVRVLRPGGPEVFHANGIYVYGEPAA